MIQVIAGKKGSGKTKRILDMVNEKARDSQHDIVFVDKDKSYMYDLRHEVRFVDSSEYGITSDQMFMGLLCGIVSSNFDLGLICIDAFRKQLHSDLASSEWFFDRLSAMSENHNVDFVLSIGEEPENLPEFVRKYVI